ncbi:hypothetical protein OB2597_00285 [Pseudooceanicola batsensis HTCC2597]|uniref:Lipoprotein n=1 Tax=Pseudooceanicola batsensis (strain ATCC BAA-863 / DSM 15984 / KCTC 12145 / HTCC2597) TaxID=252305 RepID=A3U1M7_PSEBH|nr:hypothetical protein [Pseudooceanicola batsensis]EAQ01808.1 hypothetical protein OB2597_00285 [Pseudooceanicola batsensis HTCC2597]
MTRILILALVAVTALSACSRQGGGRNLLGNRVEFDGQYFRTRVSSDRENRAAFVVTVRDPGRSLVGAREAARHKANEYCIRQYGLSDIEWDISPDAEDAALPIIDRELVLSGVCEGWR